jgi:CRISPR-associated protein Csm1
MMTFAHIAALAREQVDGSPCGRPLLAILKADVDRLGFLFGRGLSADRTPGRVGALSRLLDGFFAGTLPALLRARFPHTYTVYAGGDDLLLVAPWRDGIALASALRDRFAEFTAGNPNVTLSAGLAFVHADQPLNRAVKEAEERLEAAKEAGRDRVSLIVEQPLTWPDLARAEAEAEWLNEQIRADAFGTTLLHRLLQFADMRARAEAKSNPDPYAALWCPRWGYHKRRLEDRLAREGKDAQGICERLDMLLRGPMPGQVPARVPITIALWRNR